MKPDELKSLADAKFKHAVFRKNLRERIEAQLAVAHNGGLFKATPELITFLFCWIEDEVFLEDQYRNPIKCNRAELLKQVKEAYQYAMNTWHIDFENSKRIRSSTHV
jgi:hypothetical protein